ncbi:MAG TPA: bifunctional riboflavin kinase/FAD synthetase [Steroidobacteraceae bacterium]|nr:bifunctional riboflavin kinase/FAD synthetase [Steroidobacteraceae bacterium]
MELIRGLHNLRARHHGCVATIGTFDGVHLGHQDILRRVCGHASRLGVPSTLVSFEPMPREFLDPANAPPRLTRLRDKCAILEWRGLDRFLVLRFDSKLQAMTGLEFVVDLLIARLGAQQVVIGHDFRFGAGGATTGATLERSGSQLGFAVEIVAPVMVLGERVSSTNVRAALARGDLEAAERLLGRRYQATGRVVRGEQLGRKLGFATANLKLRRSFPLWGIFAVRAAREGGPLQPGVASVGTRPTVNGKEPVLEVHLFDFAGEFYGEHLRVEFVRKLREERRFPSLEDMVVQMHEDARQAKAALAAARH